jgi:GTPase
MQRSRNGRSTPTRNGAVPEGRARQRAFCIAALPEGEDLSELRELLNTAGVAVVGQAVQHRDRPHPNSYVGPGKLEEVKELAKRADANVIACDDELSPRQERNLEKELGLPVVDRTATILDIFAAHAHTAEGKLQVELAQLEYNLARMRGLWSHLERLGGVSSGGFATRGPGESQIETDRRLARDRIAALKRRLADVKGSRAVMRAERERAHLPQVALTGYTNAGKSTLLNALTGADVGVRDRLFHTLDPTTRTARLGGRAYLLTDTVGFIRKLPHNLVASFRATLEETAEADLLVHVIDASSPSWEEQRVVVEEVLDDLGLKEQPKLLVFNKIDLLEHETLLNMQDRIGALVPQSVFVSTVAEGGLEPLKRALTAAARAGQTVSEVRLSPSEGKLIAEIHRTGEVLDQRMDGEQLLLRARLDESTAGRLRRAGVDVRTVQRTVDRRATRTHSAS